MDIDVNKILEGHMRHINIASQEACLYFTKQNAVIEPFPGCTTHLTEKDCRQIYADLLREMIARKVPYIDKYNMSIVVKPLGRDEHGNTKYQLRFGLIF